VCLSNRDSKGLYTDDLPYAPHMATPDVGDEKRRG
jgi:hypothetical protein